jgi:hypothetical protein
MSKLFGPSHRQLQRQFDTERLADRIEQRLFREHLTDDDRAFIERMDLFFLATADAAGRPNCSYKGGDPGLRPGDRYERLRVNGLAARAAASSVDPPYPEAQFVVRVSVHQVFPNCPRYIRKMQRIERSKFVPRPAVRTRCLGGSERTGPVTCSLPGIRRGCRRRRNRLRSGK